MGGGEQKGSIPELNVAHKAGRKAAFIGLDGGGDDVRVFCRPVRDRRDTGVKITGKGGCELA